MAVTVLYEDRRGDDNDFGLHDFVCQCVIDRLSWTSRTFYDIRKTFIQGVPAGGDSNLRKLTTIPENLFAESIGKRRHSRHMRDRVFIRCALELTVDTRRQLLDQLPDIGRLVSRVAAHLQTETPDE